MAATHEISTPARSKQWYDDDIAEINGPIRTLLEGYAKVPPQEVVPYVNEIVSVFDYFLRLLLILCFLMVL